MSQPIIEFDAVGKRFCRTKAAAVLYAFRDAARNLMRMPPRAELRKDEFWALREITFTAGRGECIGIIGPNGAGKSTLLKLVNRDYPADGGRVAVRGRVTSLIRLGADLQPLLTGRENIYIKCAELGLGKGDTDAMLDGIVAFAGLEKSLDSPVKQYSDGMYARLEFSIATAAPLDILLIDEVLAVGDVAFQMRCLDRLEQLKRGGTTILFVSHSEMNVRHIADRCLLLFAGEALAFGDTDALFLKYYETLGFLNRKLKPLGASPECPADFQGPVHLTAVRAMIPATTAGPSVRTGQPLELELHCTARTAMPDSRLVLQFWSSAGLLLGSYDAGQNGGVTAFSPGHHSLRLKFPFLGLTPGTYRLAGGFLNAGQWLGYGSDLLRLTVTQDDLPGHQGLFAMMGELRATSGGDHAVVSLPQDQRLAG